MFMYYLVLVAMVLNSPINGESDPFDSCVELFKPNNIELNCCDNVVLDNKSLTDCDISDASAGDECAMPNCIMNKMGYLDSNMRVNETAAVRGLNAVIAKHPEGKAMAQRVKLVCLDKQYEDYAPIAGVCDSIKFMICAYANSMVECQKWKDTEPCMKFGEATKKCKKVMDDMAR